MNLLKRTRTCSASVAAAIVALATITTGIQRSAEAADYPVQPIVLIVPYPAGGGNYMPPMIICLAACLVLVCNY